ncbi:endonuclease domain-containing protein [Devosia sp.]|uniref:endonuclease domain-containing protein n=1 Tax=Devosia sp. TaxID=1871048 RepID=UPI002FC8266B
MPSTSLARKLRLEQTPAERRFWTIIESYRTDGWHFRRQAPIGPYIVDFACKQARLVFAIDGDSHYSDAGIAVDTGRAAYLKGRGYQVIRFTNLDVMTNPEGVWYEVGVALKSTHS